MAQCNTCKRVRRILPERVRRALEELERRREEVKLELRRQRLKGK